VNLAAGDVYQFVFRGFLAEQALDRAGRKKRSHSAELDAKVADTLSLGLLNDDKVARARAMATVYTAIAAFENSVRDLIAGVLLEEKGENWWASCVSEKIRSRADNLREEEKRIRWHTARGADPIYYTTMGDLVSILRQNWPHFEPYIPSIDWAANIMDTLQRSRNVIMHSGQLDRPDIERIGILLRDWLRQVGA
jgi:hypothetical protein